MAVLLALTITVVAIGDDGGPQSMPEESLAPQVVVEAPPSAPAYGVWDRLAMCESTQNWSANTGNGYTGGLQFDQPTWRAYGGLEYAGAAYLATRTQQIAVAERLHAARGFQPWPVCSRRLGLRP